MVIDENPESEVEVSSVAFVDKPAIEKNFMAFKGVKLDFATDAARQIVSGPAMVPDTLIYRRDQQGEYQVFFTKETIERIALKFLKKDYNKNLNLSHDPNLSLQGVTIFESFVSDKARGIQPMKGYEDLPDGTWFISAKVENPEVWQKITSGQVKGFSVEGIFSYVKKPKGFKEELEESLSGTYPEKVHFLETQVMSVVKDLIAKFKKEYFDGTPLVTPAPAAPTPAPQGQQMDLQLKDGTQVSVDKMEVGGVLLIGGMPAPAGEHEFSDGTKVTVGEGGVITLVTPVNAAVAQPALTMAEVEMAINKALTAYTEKMAAEKLAQATATTQTLTKQNETIKELFNICEQLAEIPTVDSPTENRTTFSSEKVAGKEAQRAKLVAYFQKKNKTA